MYLLVSSIAENFKKSLDRMQSSGDTSFSGTKWLIGPNRNFSRKSNIIFLIYLSVYLSMTKSIEWLSQKLVFSKILSPQPSTSEEVHRAPCRANNMQEKSLQRNNESNFFWKKELLVKLIFQNMTICTMYGCLNSDLLVVLNS